MRENRASRRLAAAIDNNSTVGLRLVLFPVMLAKYVAGEPLLHPARQHRCSRHIRITRFDRG